MKISHSKKKLREFSYIFGIGFPLLIGFLIPLIFRHEFRIWTIFIGLTVFFGFLGLIFYKLVQTKASIWGEQSKIYRGLKLKNQKESFGAIRDIKILGKEKNSNYKCAV